MAEHKEFAVELIVTTEHTYTVLARTPEEAIANAEDLFDSGDEGTITATSIDNADAISADAYASSEEFEEEEQTLES
jgi:hypothetical protein